MNYSLACQSARKVTTLLHSTCKVNFARQKKTNYVFYKLRIFDMRFGIIRMTNMHGTAFAYVTSCSVVSIDGFI